MGKYYSHYDEAGGTVANRLDILKALTKLPECAGSIREIFTKGNRLVKEGKLEYRRTNFKGHSGGWAVWDWEDRVQRYLKTLEKMKLVQRVKEGKTYQITGKGLMQVLTSI